MILGSVQEHSTLAPQQSNDKSDAQSLSGQRIHLASVCMVIAGILLSAPSALSDAQMERLSDVLLGLLYFVLPIGFGLTLFLHDRYQAYRASLLEAQIKLLEKLWEQTPQA